MLTSNKQQHGVARQYRDARIGVIPIQANGSKEPYHALLPENDAGKPCWSKFKRRLPTEAEIDEMFNTTAPLGVAIVGGVVSGCEIIDVDSGDTWHEFERLVKTDAPGLLDRIPQVMTPRDGGGRHLYVFTESPGACCTLAADEEGNKLIEVKGHGGYVLAPGSHAKCHPSKRTYKHVRSTPKITDRPVVTADERGVLFAAALGLNRHDQADDDQEDGDSVDPTADPSAPGNVYMSRETFATAGLLEQHGWKQLGEYGDRISWTRPDRDEKPGFSALSGPDRHGNDRINVFSNQGGPLKEGRSYNLFQCLAALEHEGRYDRAALALQRDGYASDEDNNQVQSVPLPDEPLLWQPFPIDLLPGACVEFVTAGAKTLSCDPAFIAVPLLAALGGAIGYRRAIQLRSDYVQPATIWAGVVAPSGTVKSPAWRLACRPLQHIQDLAYAEYRDIKERFDEEQEELATWKRQRNRKEGDRPEVGDRPICVRHVVDDITIEKLGRVLEDNPAGVIACRDELAGWLMSMDQYKAGQGADESRWIEIWNGGWLTYDRVSTEEPVRLRHPSVSLIGSIQPGVFDRVITGARLENGLAQRVLWARPPLSTQTWVRKDISTRVMRRTERLFSRLVGLEMGQDPVGLSPVIIPVSEAGIDVWQPWYEDFDRRAHDQDEMIRSAWTKLHVYCSRFALITHLVNRPDGKEIDAETISTAIQLAEWFAAEIKRVYTMSRSDQDDQELMQIAEAVHRRGGTITASRLSQSGPRFVRGDSKAAEAVLDGLVTRGWGRWTEKASKKQRGRPTRVFQLLLHSTSETGSSEPSSDDVEIRI